MHQDDGRQLLEEINLSGWLPDETLYSWCSRYHHLSCHRLPSTTTMLLFGHQHLGSAHDFPTRIDQFVQRTQSKLGTVEEIIQQRTILPLFLPFNDPSLDSFATDALRSFASGSLKFRLGLLTSHFRANFPLKACVECIVSDLKELGTSYWHRSHQLPGTWLCHRHGTELCESFLKSTGTQRFGWILPDLNQLRRSAPTFSLTDRCSIQQLSKLADMARQLSHLRLGFHFNRHTVLACYLAKLSELELVRQSGRLKTNELGLAFMEFASCLHPIEEFSNIAPDLNSATTQVTGFLHKAPQVKHPLRHLLMIAWLYPNWRAFMAAYETNELAAHRATSAKAVNTTISSAHDRTYFLVRKLATESDMTATAIAKQLGIAVATAMVHMTCAGIQPAKRPKFLDIDKQTAMQRMLKAGRDKDQVAEKIEVSVGTVTRYLLTEIGLHDQWVAARFALAQRKARKVWLNLLRTTPTASISLLRSIAPDSYAWLYRNDRNWLKEVNQSKPRPVHTGRDVVDWMARDEALARDVAMAIAHLQGLNTAKRCSVQQVIQRVPRLKAYLSKLAKLPRTQHALAVALRRKGHPNPSMTR